MLLSHFKYEQIIFLSNLIYTQNLRDAALLFKRFLEIFGKKLIKCSDIHHVSEAAPSIMAQGWPWGCRLADEKDNFDDFFSLCLSVNTISNLFVFRRFSDL